MGKRLSRLSGNSWIESVVKRCCSAPQLPMNTGMKVFERDRKSVGAELVSSRERILMTLAHREQDGLPVDFGGGFQAGMYVSIVFKLRQALGWDQPGVSVKVVEPTFFMSNRDASRIRRKASGSPAASSDAELSMHIAGVSIPGPKPKLYKRLVNA